MMRNSWARRMFVISALSVCAAVGGSAVAADTPPTPHQRMKDCMAKQKAARSGLPKEDMKNACKDVTKTEKQNDEAAQKSADKPKPATG